MRLRDRATSALLDREISTASALLHRREVGRPPELVADAGDDLVGRLARDTGGDPVRVRHEPGPLLLALGERFPGEQVVQHLVVLADVDSPETGRADAVPLPQAERRRA